MAVNTRIFTLWCVAFIVSLATAAQSKAHDFLLCSLVENASHTRSLDSQINRANAILDRLTKIEVFSIYADPARLTVANLPIATAFTRGAREIVISGRLLQSLDASSELAFVLAHELSHLALGHSRGGKLEDEIHADRLALSLLRRSGFDPCAGVTALVRVASPYAASVQGLTARIQSLHDNSSSHCVDLPLVVVPPRLRPVSALPTISTAQLYETTQDITARTTRLF